LKFITPCIEVKYLTKAVRSKQPVASADCLDSQQKGLEVVFFHFQAFLYAVVIEYAWKDKHLRLQKNTNTIR